MNIDNNSDLIEFINKEKKNFSELNSKKVYRYFCRCSIKTIHEINLKFKDKENEFYVWELNCFLWLTRWSGIRTAICHLSWKQGIKLVTIKIIAGSQFTLIAGAPLTVNSFASFDTSYLFRRLPLSGSVRLHSGMITNPFSEAHKKNNRNSIAGSLFVNGSSEEPRQL